MQIHIVFATVTSTISRFAKYAKNATNLFPSRINRKTAVHNKDQKSVFWGTQAESKTRNKKNECRRNWHSGSSGGYGHYRQAWGAGGIAARSVACIVCEVEVSGAGDGGPIAQRDLGLNQVGVRRGEKKNQ